MAELPTYSRAGIGYADLPRLVTEDIEMGAKTWGNIGEKLDRLRAFAQSKSEEQAKAAAKKFAAENPVTQEQIDAARNPAGPIESFLGAFAGRGGTVYQDALREAQGVTLATELEIDSLSRINQIEQYAKQGFIQTETGQMLQFGYEEAALALRDMEDGYYSTVSAFNLDAALKLKAGLATKGNTVLKSILADQTKKIEFFNRAKIEDYLPNLENEIRKIWENPENYYDPTTQTEITRDSMVDALIDDIVNFSIMTGNEGYVEEIYKLKRRASQSAIINSVGEGKDFENASALISATSQNTLGRFQGIWDDMTIDERKAFSDDLYDQLKSKNDANEQAKKQARSEYEKQRADIQYEIATTTISPERRQEILKIMTEANRNTEGSDLYSWEFITKFMDGKEDVAVMTKAEFAQARQDVRTGKITPDVTAEMVNKGMLSGGEKIELDNLYATITPRNFTLNERQLETRIDGLYPEDKTMASQMKAYATNQYLEMVRNDPEQTMTYKEHADNAFALARDRANEQRSTVLKKRLIGDIDRTRRAMLPQYAGKSAAAILDLIRDDPGVIPMLFVEPGDTPSANVQKEIDSITRTLEELSGMIP